MLPWALLATTIGVRVLVVYKTPLCFWLDLATVPAWAYLYASQGLWPLLPIPLIFGALDIQGLRRWR